LPKLKHKASRLPQYFTDRSRLFRIFRQPESTEFVALPLHVEVSNQVIPKIEISHFDGSFLFRRSNQPQT